MKKLSLKTGGVLLSVTILVTLLLFSCANPVTNTVSLGSDSARTLSAGVEVFPLTAGQHIDAGTVSIWRDSAKLYVKYETNSSFTINQTHVWVGTSLTQVPVNNQGNLAPGQFPAKVDPLSGRNDNGDRDL
ncbi:MAG: hypothetical protein NT061_13625 [Spirochaetes bacterium]|nr:hypothetical protein [Spirochaetota bacterium]